MKPQRSRPLMAPNLSTIMLRTSFPRSADEVPMPTAEPRPHRDYDGRGLRIGPLDRLDHREGCERFAVR